MRAEFDCHFRTFASLRAVMTDWSLWRCKQSILQTISQEKFWVLLESPCTCRNMRTSPSRTKGRHIALIRRQRMHARNRDHPHDPPSGYTPFVCIAVRSTLQYVNFPKHFQGQITGNSLNKGNKHGEAFQSTAKALVNPWTGRQWNDEPIQSTAKSTSESWSSMVDALKKYTWHFLPCCTKAHHT